MRDLFEAFVIYTFLALVLEYAGGDAACVFSSVQTRQTPRQTAFDSSHTPVYVLL